jgi:hypothetical protein
VLVSSHFEQSRAPSFLLRYLGCLKSRYLFEFRTRAERLELFLIEPSMRNLPFAVGAVVLNVGVPVAAVGDDRSEDGGGET